VTLGVARDGLVCGQEKVTSSHARDLARALYLREVALLVLEPGLDAAELEAAIEQVIEDYPWFFDFRRARGGPTSYRVRNPAGYNREVVETLRRAGFCALDDGQEIGIKTTNDFSDHYQILSSDEFVIRGLPSYRSTCFPAWDAIP